MEIRSFDDLLAAGLAEARAQRLLLVLLQARPRDDGSAGFGRDEVEGTGTLTPVMATDLELSPGLRLDALVGQADSLGHAWDLIMVSSLSAPDGHMPTSEDAESPLQRMAQAVLSGADLSGYAVFDRAGRPVHLSLS